MSVNQDPHKSQELLEHLNELNIGFDDIMLNGILFRTY